MPIQGRHVDECSQSHHLGEINQRMHQLYLSEFSREPVPVEDTEICKKRFTTEVDSPDYGGQEVAKPVLCRLENQETSGVFSDA